MSDKSPYTEEYYWTYTFNGSTYSQIFDQKTVRHGENEEATSMFSTMYQRLKI